MLKISLCQQSKMSHEILGISVEDAKDVDLLKKAYRGALLRYHPDKQHGLEAKPTSGITVEHVRKAYKELVANEGQSTSTMVIAPSEIIDLDDLEYSEITNSWSKNCRCGEDQGYLITEDDLISNGDNDEVNVQCIGCSIWIRVQYSVVEE